MPSRWQPHAGILRASSAREVCREGSTGLPPRADRASSVPWAGAAEGKGSVLSSRSWAGQNVPVVRTGCPGCIFFFQMRWFENVCHC